MKTLSEIRKELEQQIPAEAVQPADSSAGIFGEYVTGQWAMQAANQVFGIDGIMGFDVLSDKSIEIPLPGQPFGNWVFITTLKVTFMALDDESEQIVQFSRVGRGVGTAMAPRAGGPVTPQQMDTAAKSALTDAIKNALMRTGQYLGAELYFDERMAQVLGWEVASDRAERRAESSQPTEDTAEDLGSVECKYGFGEAGEDGKKKFQGWTIQEMWDDDEGRKLFAWAVDNEASGWFNERLRKFAALMEEEGEEPVKKITIWTGDEKVATDRPNWGALCANEGFQNMLREAFDPDDRIAHFNPNHKRMTNHYKYHFGVRSGNELTWEMLNALVARCKEGEDAVAFGYPEWYGEKEEEQEPEESASEEAQEEEEYEEVAIHDTPPFVLGAGANTQKVPTGLQVLAKEAGVEDPKSWLWGSVLGKTPVGEWEEAHTDLVCRIVETIEEGKIEHDSPVVGQMWGFGAQQIADAG
ncbi:MAG: hypothetical protein GWN93_05845 [Deltaproteobacteria bacterium]|nr:hypothetical protein [Deltaproteobacteria bacterium]